MINEPAHARLSASGSSRWLNCPASVRLSAGLERPDNDFAKEGTLAHTHSEHFLLTGNWRDDITPDMKEYCTAYTSYIRKIVDDDPTSQLLIETRVSYSNIVADGFGTADAIIISGNTLHVCDLKYGEHVHVVAENNTQLMLYAIGFLNDMGYLYEVETIRLHICQPRRFNFDMWEINIQDLMTFSYWARSRAEMVADPNTIPNPGEKQCAYCPVKDKGCKALTEHMGKILFMDMDVPLEDSKPACQTPVELISDEQIRLILYNEKLITAWLSAVRGLVYNRMIEGDVIEGFKLVDGRKTKAWRDINTVTTILMDNLDNPADVYKPVEVISPAKALKLLGRKKAGVIEDQIILKEGQPTLALSIDRRKSFEDSVVDDFSMEE